MSWSINHMLTIGLVMGVALLTVMVTRPMPGRKRPLPGTLAAPTHLADAGPVAPVGLSGWAERAPFRRSRVPARMRFDPRRDDPVFAASQPQAPRPVLVLRGIVMGTEPAAVVDGLPGTEGGRAVRMGDRFGDLTVKRIERGEIVIRGSDTTWTLRLPSADRAQ